MGIIDSLSAGYRFVTRRPDLLLLPILLDGVLWLAPRLSIAPILQRLAAFYAEFGQSSEVANPDLTQLTGQMTELLTALGDSTNLLQFLVSRSLYHVPSLLATMPSIKSGSPSTEIESLGAAGGMALALGLIGLLLGVIYMNLLAQTLPLGEGHKERSWADFASRVLRHWMRTIGFLVVLTLGLLLLYIPAAIGVTVLTLISPALGSGALFLLSGLIAVLFFYLYFVSVALVLDNLPASAAVRRSIVLVRNNFWATIGFVLLTAVISTGIDLMLRRLAEFNAVGTALAAVGNAYVGTGLAMALLVFYRTRHLAMTQEQQSLLT